MYVDGDIPTVHISNWTSIDLVLVDRCGINWTHISNSYPFLSKWVWPLTHSGILIPSRDWRKFLGYTSLKLEARVSKGNPDGWHLKFNRSTITNTTTSFVHRIQLQALVDDSVIDYSVIVEIKCTRFDVYGHEMGVSYLHIPLKAMPVSNIKMNIDKVEETVSLKTVKSFQIRVTNNGDYREMFGFRAESDNHLIVRVDTSALVLNPRESKKVTLTVLTPAYFIDFGTPHKIHIYAYSYETNTTIPLGSLTVITQGIYISPLVLIITTIAVIILMIIYLLYRWLEKREQERLGRPVKPWLLLEEKEYLDELKRRDKREYHETLKMMKQEYQSAMLWYKSSIKKKRFLHPMENKVKKKEIKKEVDSLKKKPHRKTVLRLVSKPSREEVEKAIPTARVDRGKLEKTREKEKQMKKIRREQERQRKKIMRKTHESIVN
ncbi:MAG TPA: hypothetical protein ENG62_00905 [Thermoplasmatales archaeon]|nr:hypothetical protein [Thermoplasmatales archaeon]